jgi:hypothetical protein
MGSPRTRLKAARLLIALALCLGVAAAVVGSWLTTIAMGLVIAGQVLVYRRAKRDISEPK